MFVYSTDMFRLDKSQKREIFFRIRNDKKYTFRFTVLTDNSNS
jgi:hypothetical protein